MPLETLSSWRHPIAVLITSALVAVMGYRLSLPPPKPAPEEVVVMHVKLIAPPAAPKIVQPLPPRPEPPKPQPQKSEKPAVEPRTPIVPNAKMPEAPSQAGAAPVPNPAPQAPPSPPVPAAPVASNTVSLEESYKASCKEEVERVKRYPMSKDARLQRPAGTVTLVFTLNRDGKLQSQDVENTAGSILDEAAQSTVRRARCAPFPPGAWPKESEHRFRVDITFTPS